MIVLTKTTEYLKVVLAGAVAASECPIVAGYSDVEVGQRGAPGMKTEDTITTGATAVQVVAGPRSGVSRELKFLSIHNADTSSVTVTIQYIDGSTTRTLFKASLVTLENLLYAPDRGFYVVDAAGNVKTNAPSTSGNTSTADSKGDSAGTRASVADSKVLSNSTVDSTNKSVDDSRNTSLGTRLSIVESTANSG